MAALQAVNAPTRTLVEMDRGERERVLVGIAATIREALSERGGA